MRPSRRGTAPTLLTQFPGHSKILSLSPVFTAQAERWPTPSQPGRGRGTAGSKRQAKQQVTITLPDASYEPAAMAVLAGLYQVQPWRKLLADLTPQQQVQAAVLAYMWQLPAASDAAVGVLQAATDSTLAAVLEQLLSMAAVPDCLLPVFEQSSQALLRMICNVEAVPENVLPVFEHCWQALLTKYSLAAVPHRVLPWLEQVLLSKYGDLEAVWDPAAASQQESLLALPLYAMELLLASDELQVSSEDTVLFTAQAYADKLARSSRQQAVDKLAPLVRCPHLLPVWLSASVLSDDAGKLLLRDLQPQLKRLMLLKAARSTDADMQVDDIKGVVPDVPASWLLPARDIQPVSSAQVEWRLDVADIRQAARDTASQQKTVILMSPTSCLLGGIRWGMQMKCPWDASRPGSKVSLFTCAITLPAGSRCGCTYRLECVAAAAIRSQKSTRLFQSGRTGAWGRTDFFDLGAMSGGFDEAAWAAKGLPTSGSIVLRLTVSEVGK